MLQTSTILTSDGQPLVNFFEGISPTHGRRGTSLSRKGHCLNAHEVKTEPDPASGIAL
jgi:hypothetical protein